MNILNLYLSSVLVNGLLLYRKLCETLHDNNDKLDRKLIYKSNLSFNTKVNIKRCYTKLKKRELFSLIMVFAPIVNYVYTSLRYPEIEESISKKYDDLIDKVNDYEILLRETNRNLVNSICNAYYDLPISEVELIKLIDDLNIKDKVYAYIEENNLKDLYAEKVLRKIR